jgi:hypothetical protein
MESVIVGFGILSIVPGSEIGHWWVVAFEVGGEWERGGSGAEGVSKVNTERDAYVAGAWRFAKILEIIGVGVIAVRPRPS